MPRIPFESERQKLAFYAFLAASVLVAGALTWLWNTLVGFGAWLGLQLWGTR